MTIGFGSPLNSAPPLDVAGKKLELPINTSEVWDLLLLDIAELSTDDVEYSSVNSCTQYIVDNCAAELGVECSSDMVLANFAHVCPHLLSPDMSTCFVFMLCKHMSDVVGTSGSQYLRSKLVRSLLQVPDAATELETNTLLQETWPCLFALL